jgi:hypothetical protein
LHSHCPLSLLITTNFIFSTLNVQKMALIEEL